MLRQRHEPDLHFAQIFDLGFAVPFLRRIPDIPETEIFSADQMDVANIPV